MTSTHGSSRAQCMTDRSLSILLVSTALSECLLQTCELGEEGQRGHISALPWIFLNSVYPQNITETSKLVLVNWEILQGTFYSYFSI